MQASQTYRHLDDAIVAEIAEHYGLDPASRDVLGNAQQADDAHGQPAGGATWGALNGAYDAERLLEGLLSQVASERNYEARSHAEFCRDAYGA